jgi:hypothetical protein
MRPPREISVLFSLLLLGASAGGLWAEDRRPEGGMKATAPEKMMPAAKAQKMRVCEKRAQLMNIKLEDRARFVDRCMTGDEK